MKSKIQNPKSKILSPEQLIDAVIAADAIRREHLKQYPIRFKPSQRAWIEPWFNVLGLFLGQLMSMLPWTLRKPLDLWICRKMGGHAAEENPVLAGTIKETVAMARDTKQKTGQWPAFLILTSHPETEGPDQWLRFELLAQGMQVADVVAEAEFPSSLYKPHAQCFLGIDPFALDTVSVPVGAFYAAWMYRIYLAWDRQESTQSWIQRHMLLRNSGYEHIVWRLLRRLRGNIPVLMAFPGGLPQNARLLYSAREFMHSLPVQRWPSSRLTAQLRLMRLVMEPVNGLRPAEEGTLQEPTRRKILIFLHELGLSPESANEQLQRFEEEFQYAIPRRERLMNVLVNRLVEKGKPLMLLAVSHQPNAPHIRFSQPWVLSKNTDGSLGYRGPTTEEKTLDDIPQMTRQFRQLFYSKS